MADQFDPYHRWLGIPPEEQPPHHYRLLAINAFEADPEVIRDATQQRMAHVRTYQLGQYQALSQRILNELAAAKACLSDPQQKAAYDEQLRQKLARPVKSPVPEAVKRLGNARLELFVEHVIQSGLLSGAEISSYYEEKEKGVRSNLPVGPEGAAHKLDLTPFSVPQDAPALARELVRSGMLTKYQAQAIYEGRYKGLTFGEYRVVDKLGQGGMGMVLKAEHQRLERTVAVKMISRAAMKSPDAVKRFYREVKAAGKLMHPNIVAATDAGECDGMHYLVMEYVEGQDLGAMVQEKGRLPVAEAIDYILQAARGLQYAHEQGIVHRDIKPANLMVDRKGTVKILDMGLARVAGRIDEGDSDRLTGSGQAMGTCDYMAPEQAVDTHQVDARADIYALGCTLHRLLVGDAMYKGETIAKVLISHQMAPIPSLRASRPEVSPQLDAVYQKMVAKKPEERYQSMTEVIAALETCAGKGATSSAHGDESAAGLAIDGELSFLRQATGRSGTPVPDKADVRHGVPDLRQANFWRKKPLWIAVAAAGAGIILLTIVIRIRRPDGTEQVIPVPDGTHVTVSHESDHISPRPLAGEGSGVRASSSGGTALSSTASPSASSGKVVGGEGHTRSPLRAPSEAWSGEGSGVRASPPPGAVRVEGSGVPAVARSASEARGEGTAISPRPPSGRGARGEGTPPSAQAAPPPAIAPFDAATAKQHQAAWAKYLGVPVTETNSIGMKLVLIPPGEFGMGSTPEEVSRALEEVKKNNEPKRLVERIESEAPQHRVKITKPFYLSLYSITQGEYEKLMGVNPSAFVARQMDASAFKPPLSEAEAKDRQVYAKRVAVGMDTSRFPVETVSWDDAMEFCRRLSATPAEIAVRRVYRLPTEAEWEYACRAGTTTHWYSGDDETGLKECAWFFGGTSGGITHPVGKMKPNAWALYDMCGNVSQWCADWFSTDYFKQSASSDPAGPTDGSNRVTRGGAWSTGPSRCRSASRERAEPAKRLHYNGLRVVGDVPQAGRSGTPVPDIRNNSAAQPSPPAPLPQAREGRKLTSVPPDAVTQAAEKRAQDVYHAEYLAAKSAAGRQAVAKKILHDALQPHSDSAERFVLLCLARDVAVAAQDENTAMTAIDELDRTFAVDTVALKADALDRVAKGYLATPARGQLAQRALALAEEALKADKLAAADDLAKLAMTQAAMAHDKELVSRARAAGKEIQEAIQGSAAAKAAQQQLQQNPADAEAHLALGSYLCVIKRDWEAGLPHLAKAGNQPVAPVAAADLVGPQEAAKQVEMGDAWLKLTEKPGTAIAGAYRARAARWYQKALPQLDGLARSRVQTTLAGLKVADADWIPPDLGLKDPDTIPPGKVLEYKPTPADIKAIAAMPDGRSFLATGEKGKVIWYRTADGAFFLTIRGERGISGLQFPPMAGAVCVGSDRSMHVLDLNSKQWTDFPVDAKPLRTPVFFQDSRRVLCAMECRVLDLDRKQEIVRFGTPHSNSIACMSLDDRVILYVWAQMVQEYAFDSALPREIRRLKGHTEDIQCVAISPNGRLAISGGLDQTARLWDVQTGTTLHVLSGHKDTVRGAAFIYNGRYAITAAGGVLRLWNVADGKLIISYPAGGDTICPLPDNRFMLCGHAGAVSLWKFPLTKTGRLLEGNSADDGSSLRIRGNDRRAADERAR